MQIISYGDHILVRIFNFCFGPGSGPHRSVIILTHVFEMAIFDSENFPSTFNSRILQNIALSLIIYNHLSHLIGSQQLDLLTSLCWTVYLQAMIQQSRLSFDTFIRWSKSIQTGFRDQKCNGPLGRLESSHDRKCVF